VNVLVIGSGGREHALCWALGASPLVDTLFCAPGNGGIADVARCLPIEPLDFDGLIAACRKEAIEFVVIGPEAPLVAGLADRLEQAGIKAFGPSARAAMLEGSKGFMKDICARHGIATAAYGRFADAAGAKAFIRQRGAPIVVKADGLAAGKGVVVVEETGAAGIAEAEAAVDEMFAGEFGDAGRSVVVEEYLQGEEVSFFVLCDGRHALALATAQDHKRIGDGDSGPNTGGMGAYSPAPALTPELERRVMAEIVRPLVAAMAAEGRPYLGVLYAGLMLCPGGPKLLEINARFGDPECQVLMARLKSDLLPALLAARDGVLDSFDLRWRPEAAICVVMAAKGYPGEYRKGGVIENLKAAEDIPGVTVFHAGTKRDGGRLLANGGRVLGVTATGRTVAEAQARAYKAVAAIRWADGYYRRDIGWRAIARETAARAGQGE
jgi:phosphoribosylamine---glycine ligase